MKIIETSIPDVKLIKPRRFDDERGFFQQTYHQKQYQDAGIPAVFVQDNWSHSSKGVLRGLHYQLKHPQSKLVSVIRGEVFDIAVDIRQGSPTFGKWVGEVLSAGNGHQLYVPEGFAHGFCILSDTADVMYKCSDFYIPEDEYGLRWNDPDLGIEWPDLDFLVSEKDQQAPKMNAVNETHFPDFNG